MSRPRVVTVFLTLLLSLVAITGLSVRGQPALAQMLGPKEPPQERGGTSKALSVSVTPMLNTDGTLSDGAVELAVRLTNSGNEPIKGEIRAKRPAYVGASEGYDSVAPFAVGAKATVVVPVMALGNGDCRVTIEPEGGTPFENNVTVSAREVVRVLDLKEASALRGVMHERPLTVTFAPMMGRGVSESRSLVVAGPTYDSATGDPVLPSRPAAWHAIDVIVVPSDTWVRLSDSAREAIAGYVLAGGTLALSFVRPEDLRDESVSKLIGGALEETNAPTELRKPVYLPADASSGAYMGGTSSNGFAEDPPLPETLDESFRGYAGGNLHPSAYGASAPYGLGEVIALGFSPYDPQSLETPWVQQRIAAMARRAHDRRATILFRPGAPAAPEYGFGYYAPSNVDAITRLLDPNQGARWAIAVAALLLCAYAVFAGPLNFSRAARKGHPLRALLHLPAYALGMFVVVVGVGIAAKGPSGRSRRVSLVDAAAGMEVASIRRYRGFYLAESDELTVWATDSTSVLSNLDTGKKSSIRIDRDGLRMVDVPALPWRTAVVREDGFTAIGNGISIVDQSGRGATITNRTGRTLRGVVIHLPTGETNYFDRIEDGEMKAVADGRDLSRDPEVSHWAAGFPSTAMGFHTGGVLIHNLDAHSMGPLLEDDAPGLAEAWQAMEEAAGYEKDWFPLGVPILLAQIDTGEGVTDDTGLPVESDRMLIRVTGWGGKP